MLVQYEGHDLWYPIQESMQKYLWPRLCFLNQNELYELHYQMITFGKVFCTKRNPNCGACPMKDVCQHYISKKQELLGKLSKPPANGDATFSPTAEEKQAGHPNKTTDLATQDPSEGALLYSNTTLEAANGADKNKELARSPVDEHNPIPAARNQDRNAATSRPINVHAPLIEELGMDSIAHSHGFCTGGGQAGCPVVVDCPEVEECQELDGCPVDIIGRACSPTPIFTSLKEGVQERASGAECETFQSLVVEEVYYCEPEEEGKQGVGMVESQALGGFALHGLQGEETVCTVIVEGPEEERETGESEQEEPFFLEGHRELEGAVEGGRSREQNGIDIDLVDPRERDKGKDQSAGPNGTDKTGVLPRSGEEGKPEVASATSQAVMRLPEVAVYPQPPLKEAGKLRSIHYVYELPDDSVILSGLPCRLKDDPCPYLLAIWGPGESPPQPPALDNQGRDLSSSAPAAPTGPPTVEEGAGQSGEDSTGAEVTVPGTLLIPCRTAMRGSFPLNGTYFNEVFADHLTSQFPLSVPRSQLWNLRRRFVLFGTSVPTVFRGLSKEEIRAIFWKGYICIRGFDRKTRFPKQLVERLHSASRSTK